MSTTQKHYIIEYKFYDKEKKVFVIKEDLIKAAFLASAEAKGKAKYGDNFLIAMYTEI